MLSPFSVLKKESSKFKSLNIWKQLKDGGNDLSWYLAVSTNRMPAKYLISKSILCNITDLSTKPVLDWIALNMPSSQYYGSVLSR